MPTVREEESGHFALFLATTGPRWQFRGVLLVPRVDKGSKPYGLIDGMAVVCVQSRWGPVLVELLVAVGEPRLPTCTDSGVCVWSWSWSFDPESKVEIRSTMRHATRPETFLPNTDVTEASRGPSMASIPVSSSLGNEWRARP